MMEVLRRQELHAIWLGKKFARYLAASHKLGYLTFPGFVRVSM